jgi:hypothetical protein
MASNNSRGILSNSRDSLHALHSELDRFVSNSIDIAGRVAIFTASV